MKYFAFIIAIFAAFSVYGQGSSLSSPANIYTIRQQMLSKYQNNPEGEADDELAKFNRWFYMMEKRCYPSGNLPEPSALLKAYIGEKASSTAHPLFKTTGGSPAPWTAIGPKTVPGSSLSTQYPGSMGIGRINCVTLGPQDTNSIYVGAACGGVFISHNAGATWTSGSDNFPSLSVSDIVVNPYHADTIFASTGDENGTELDTSLQIFWGGLYTAGVIMSADGGNTWNTTGLSFLQADRDLIKKLLMHPLHPGTLLAATRHGIYRTSDAGQNWQKVFTGNVFSMVFHPFKPDTIYATTVNDLIVSYNAGASWQTLYPNISHPVYFDGLMQARSTIAVSPASPKSIWVLDNLNTLKCSHDEGHTFDSLYSGAAGCSDYDKVLAVSPFDSNIIYQFCVYMYYSMDGGHVWGSLAPYDSVHADPHAITFNPLNPTTLYTGNDGGIYVAHGTPLKPYIFYNSPWTNLSNGLMISQIYRASSSRQNPNLILCGLQDNNTIRYDGTKWLAKVGGDGMANAVYARNDSVQLASYQNGKFYLSADKGNTFNQLSMPELGPWISPVLINTNCADTMYFGLTNLWASYDRGNTFTNISSLSNSYTPFKWGLSCMAMAPSNTKVIYAADAKMIMRTTDAGATWTVITGNLPSAAVAITHIAVDFTNPMIAYITTSGYNTGSKVFVNNTADTVWSNISYNLPNIPANCIAIDSSTKGALFVGTDMGVYYTDSSLTGNWIKYSTGLPNVIVDDIDINYANYKVRAATYGRGLWECDLPRGELSIPQISQALNYDIQLYPNPANSNWNLIFGKNKPAAFTVKIYDMADKLIYQQANTTCINNNSFPAGLYIIDVSINNAHNYLKGIKN